MLRPGALGDTLLALPALRALRAIWPDAELTLAAHRAAAQLLAGCGEVDVGLGFEDASLAWLWTPLRGLDTPGRPRGGAPECVQPPDTVVGWLTDAEDRLRRLLAARRVRRVLLAPSRPASADCHVARYLWETLAPLARPLPAFDPGPLGPGGAGEAARRPRSDRGAADEHDQARRPTTHTALVPPRVDAGMTEGGASKMVEPGHNVSRAAAEDGDGAPGGQVAAAGAVLLHPGSGSARKNWPAGRFAAVAEMLLARGAQVRLAVGEADVEAAERVEQALGQPLSRVTEPSLGELARLLAGCRAYLGNDSGVSHLAGLVGAPTFALFGPTDPRQWQPLGPRVTVLPFDTSPAAVASALLAAQRR